MRKWHKQHNIPFAYIWIIENTSEYVGLHSHIVLYSNIHQFDDLSSMITGWLPFERDDLSYADAKGTNIKITKYSDDLIDYLCKGIDIRDTSHIGRRKDRGKQGYIDGRRWGYCRDPILPN